MNKHQKYLINKTDKEFGYYKEYYVKLKYIGRKRCDKDREVIGYAGKQTHVASEDIKFKNKRIKAGQKYITILYPLSA